MAASSCPNKACLCAVFRPAPSSCPLGSIKAGLRAEGSAHYPRADVARRDIGRPGGFHADGEATKYGEGMIRHNDNYYPVHKPVDVGHVRAQVSSHWAPGQFPVRRQRHPSYQPPKGVSRYGRSALMDNQSDGSLPDIRSKRVESARIPRSHYGRDFQASPYAKKEKSRLGPGEASMPHPEPPAVAAGEEN